MVSQEASLPYCKASEPSVTVVNPLTGQLAHVGCFVGASEEAVQQEHYGNSCKGSTLPMSASQRHIPIQDIHVSGGPNVS